MQAAKDRLSNQKVSDIQFDDLRHRRDRGNRIKGQPVARMDFKGLHGRVLGRGCKPLQLMCERGVIGSQRHVAICAGMEFDHIGANIGRGFDLRQFGIDEERHPDTGIPELGYEGPQILCANDNIEATFRRQLLPAFGHQAAGMRAVTKCDFQHFVGGSHFEIEGTVELRLQPDNIGIRYVTAIFAQMRGDIIGACLHSEIRRPNWIGMNATARIANCSDVIDVDAEPQVGRFF